MYSQHRITIPASDAPAFQAMLSKLSRELEGTELAPIYDEDDNIVEYELSGFLPDTVIAMLDDPKLLTKRLKEKGDNASSEANSRALLNKLRRGKPGGPPERGKRRGNQRRRGT